MDGTPRQFHSSLAHIPTAAALVTAALVLSGCGGPSTPPPPRATPSASSPNPLSAPGALAPTGPAGPQGPEGVPIPAAPLLTGAGTSATGKPVDGIECDRAEQLAFHIHTHLTVYVAGAARQIPAGIGIGPPQQVKNTPAGAFIDGGSCFYWLHTHAADGIIHMEAPVQRGFTLGDFFDIWGQPLSSHQVGPATGPVTAFSNGKPYPGDPRGIPLGAYTQIQLEVGTPLVVPESITFPSTL